MSRFTVVLCMIVMLLAGQVYAQPVVVRERVRPRAVEVSIDFKQGKFSDVVEYIARQAGRNIIIEGEIDDTITLRLVGVKWRRALDAVCQQVGAVIEEEGDDILRISKPETINFELEDAPLGKVIGTIAKMAEATVIIGPNVKGVVTAQFYDVPWTKALDYIVRTSGFVVLKEGKIFRIMDPATLEAHLVTRVFQLRYIQPPEEYTPRLDSKFAPFKERTIAGFAGVGEEMGMPGVVPIAGRPRPARAAARGGTASEFPLLNAIQRVASKKGRVDYVPSTNSLIVTDTEPNVKAIAELIETMDREPLQCFIDIKFISTDVTNRDRHGVDWTNGLTFTSTYGSVVSKLPFNLNQGGFEDYLAVTTEGPSAADIAAGITDIVDRTGPFSFGLLDFRQMSQTMDFFMRDENSELKQSPQLIVLDNHQATIFVGETIRFAETDSASNQAGGVEVGIREATGSPVDTGFQLLVRPHIVAGEDKVVLTVIPKAETLSGTGETIAGFDDFTNGVATIQLPRVASSTLVTKLILKHGQTAVLGGMIQEVDSEEERKVPLLGDIPILGWAFKWKSKLKSRNNLLVFITVFIVRSDSDVKEIYTVYGSKYGGKTYQHMQEEAAAKWNRTKGGGYKGAHGGVAGGDL